MNRLFDFLKEADTESIRRSHRRQVKEIAASISKGASLSKEVPAPTTSSRQSVQRTPVSKIKGWEAARLLYRQPKGVHSCQQAIFTVGRRREIQCRQ